MTKDEMKEYEIILLEEKRKILKEFSVTDEAAMDILEHDLQSIHDAADESIAKATQDVLDMMNTRHENILIGIDNAISRIKEETYGRCLSCSARIDDKRLKTIPWAPLCINCKTKSEQSKR